jgi:hypothetical protein
VCRSPEKCPLRTSHQLRDHFRRSVSPERPQHYVCMKPGTTVLQRAAEMLRRPG